MAPKQRATTARCQQTGARQAAATAKPAKAPCRQASSAGHTNAGKAPSKKNSASCAAAKTQDAKARSQVDRRDLVQKALRTLEGGRLDHIPKSLWMHKTDAEGKTLPDYTAKAIAAKGGNGRLSTSWWSDTMQRFGLWECVELPEPESQDEAPAELLEALQALRQENLIKCTHVPLERVLEHLRPLGPHATWGLLMVIQSGPELPMAAAIKAQMAVARYWARRCL